MSEAVLIVTTGGTIDKVYFDAKSAYAVGEPQIAEVLRQAHINENFRMHSLMRKDSLEMEESDRIAIRDTIEASSERRVLVTHGTDTMTETATCLQSIEGRTIVLTGALIPARFRENDALFNIGFAWAAMQILPTGVYIAMNGCLFRPGEVRKDHALNRFVRIADS
jgi:L-asparaginase